jgi:hypothetical protein
MILFFEKDREMPAAAGRHPKIIMGNTVKIG